MVIDGVKLVKAIGAMIFGASIDRLLCYDRLKVIPQYEAVIPQYNAKIKEYESVLAENNIPYEKTDITPPSPKPSPIEVFCRQCAENPKMIFDAGLAAFSMYFKK